MAPEDRSDDQTTDQTTMGELARLLGIPELEGPERDAVLDLTRVVAHTVERRFGPLVAYALGVATGSGTDPSDRTQAVRDAIRRLQDRATDSGAP